MMIMMKGKKIKDKTISKKINKKSKRNMKNIFSSFFKSTVYTLTLLSIIMSSLCFYPQSTSYAANTEKKVYRYIIDFGKELDTKSNRGIYYTYEIIVKQPETVSKPSDIEVISKNFTHWRVSSVHKTDALNFRDRSGITFYDYMMHVSGTWDSSNGDIYGKETLANVRKIYRDLCCAIIDGHPSGDGTCYQIWGNMKYTRPGTQFIQYVSHNAASDGTTEEDPKYSGYHWGKWGNKDKQRFLQGAIGEGNVDPATNVFYCITGPRTYDASSILTVEASNGIYVRQAYTSNGNQITDTVDVSLKDFLSDDRNVAYAMANAIQDGNKFGFIREEIGNKDSKQSYGGFAYNVRDVDNDSGTLTVDVYQMPYLWSGANKVYSFRYQKGATNRVSDPVVKIVQVNPIPNSYYSDKTGLMAYIKTSTLAPSYSSEMPLFPRIMADGTVGDPFGKQLHMADTTEDSNIDDHNPKTLAYYFNESVTDGAYSDKLDTGNYNVMAFAAGYSQGSSEDTNMINVYYVTRQRSTEEAPFALFENYVTYRQNYEDVKLFHENGESLHDSDVLKTIGTKLGEINVSYALSIPQKTLDAYFDEGVETITGTTKTCGNWKLVYNRQDGVLQAYNTTQSDDEPKMNFFMNFKKNGFYKIITTFIPKYFTKYSMGSTIGDDCDVSYKLHLAMNEDKKLYNNNMRYYKFYNTQTDHDGTSHSSRHGAFLIANCYLGSAYTDKGDVANAEDSEEALLQNMKKVSATTDGMKIQLMFYDINAANKSQRGLNDEIILKEDDFVKTSGNELVVFDITDWFWELFPDERESILTEEIERGTAEAIGVGGFVVSMMTKEELQANQNRFLEVLFKYAKPIIMFLIFLALTYAAIFSIMNSQDAKQRVLLKERMKHIVIGAIAFACIVIILILCRNLMTQSFEVISDLTADGNINALAVPQPEIEQNWFINMLTSVINAIADIFDWLINTILNSIVGGDSGTDLNYIIFNKGVSESQYSLAPFTGNEWLRYMYGYQALEALAIALLAIGIIKFSIELVINAGNAEKITEGKQSILRIVIALMATILGPYIVRLFLLLFNYLITLVPIKDIDLELTFENTGILGAAANVMFAWTKFQIYLAFVVRKLMITFMLLITPVVFGLWTISDKFRSLSLWIGELVTNCATQFCYALVFFIAGLIMYENQSDFVSLIIIMMFVKLADFFKDSLQGLVQKWGGIDETGVAQNVAGTMVQWGKKTISTAKNVAGFAGGLTTWIADRRDPNGVSTGGRVARNVGTLLQGNIWGLQTRGDQAANMEKELKSRRDEAGRRKNNIEEEINKSGDVELKDKLREYKKGSMTEAVKSKVASDPRFGLLKDYMEADGNWKKYNQGATKAAENKENSSNFVDRIRNNGRNATLNQFKEGVTSAESHGTNSEAIQRQYDDARSSLANKTADMMASRNLFDQGKINEQQLVKSCEETLKAAQSFMDTARAHGNIEAPGMMAQDEIMKAVSDIQLQAGSKLEEFTKSYQPVEAGKSDSKDVELYKADLKKRQDLISKAFNQKKD